VDTRSYSLGTGSDVSVPMRSMRSPRMSTTLLRTGTVPVPSINVPPTSAIGFCDCAMSGQNVATSTAKAAAMAFMA